MEKIQTVKIQNPEYGDTYTAHIQKNGTGWIGHIQEVPEVQCSENMTNTCSGSDPISNES